MQGSYGNLLRAAVSTGRGVILRRTTAILSVLLIILCCTACSWEHKAAKGFMLDIASARKCGEDDIRRIVATAIAGRRARLGVEPDGTIPEVALRLRDVTSYRAEKLVYVKADAGVSWGEFLELIDVVWPVADVVSTITPQVEALAHGRYCLTPSCGDCVKLRRFRLQ